MHTHRRVDPDHAANVAALTAGAIVCLFVGMLALYAGVSFL